SASSFFRRRALALAACVVLSGCAAHDDFLKAQATGTLQAWGDYVKRYPTEGHPGCDDCVTARKNYDAALAQENDAWTQAQADGAAAAYLDFLGKHDAASPHFAPALEAAVELLKKGQADEGDYATYFSQRQDEAPAAEIRRALAGLRYRKAKASAEPGASAYFEAQYPGTSEAAKLEAHWANAELERAKKFKTRLALDYYLKRFPGAAGADEARALLAELPRAEPLADDGSALELLPKLREASSALRGQECLGVLAELVKKTGEPYGAAAERLRGEFAAASNSDDIAACRNARLKVPEGAKALVGSAVRSLALLSQRRMKLSSLFSGEDVLTAKSRKIGKTASGLSETAEAFDLEMQAYYGYMPADPDKPQEKASKDAAEAVRRARRAFELSQGGLVAEKKSEAADVVGLMNAQEDLLVAIIAEHEKPERRAP
ncbi:MAG TPA: hypothetical protein VH309_04010, partial [Elusimicrobiota bacterium]|nr:hypothetical protein [Elusimicrobiota bacterium]